MFSILDRIKGVWWHFTLEHMRDGFWLLFFGSGCSWVEGKVEAEQRSSCVFLHYVQYDILLLRAIISLFFFLNPFHVYYVQ